MNSVLQGASFMEKQRIRFWIRRVLIAGVSVGAALGAVRVLSFQGLIKPVRLAGGSMAPAFLGPRYQVACGECGYAWPIDATQSPATDYVVCPNCGFANNPLAGAALLRGQRVLIDRGAWWLRRPRRWDAAAVADPQQPTQLAVKRIVGLPGEKVEIQDGEVLINGRIARKSLSQLRRMAVPVYDDRFRPANADLPRRWQDSESRWAAAGGAFHYPGDFQPLANEKDTLRFAWLRYHHWRCSPLPGLRTKESPILDDDGYNLGPPRRLNPVSDVLLGCLVRTTGDGCLAVSLHDGREIFELHCWPQRGGWKLWRQGRLIANGEFPRIRDEVEWRLETALCDQQVIAAIDGQEVLIWRYEPSAGPSNPSPGPLALGAAGLAVEVRDLTVARDVYYLPPRGQEAWVLSQPLAGNEYLLLGDNAAISQDSRTWRQPALAQDQLQGRVLHGPFSH
jgi:signal peptidase I